LTTPLARSQDAGSRAADSDWLARFARVGLAARGLIYILVGVLAIEVARGASERTDQEGALRRIAEQPFGRSLLWLVAVGLVAYGLWRIGEGIYGRREETDEKTRTLKRGESLASGVLNIILALTAARLAAGGGKNGGRSLSARLLEAPGGKEIMVGLGLVVIGAGLALAWRGLKTDFERQLKSGEMGPTTYAVVHRLGQLGYLARGLVVSLAGALVVKAALEQEPDQAAGLDVALKSLAEAPYGRILLVVAAAGLICFGAYSFAEVRYRRL
jgi:hypothetical protein